MSFIQAGKDLMITDTRMTRFLLSLDDSVSLIFGALREGKTGELYIPKVPTAKMTDLAGDRNLKWVETGIRPGEKLDEILISEDEGRRAFTRGQFYVIPSSLPELQDQYSDEKITPLSSEYSSGDNLMNKEDLKALLAKNNLLVENVDYREDNELIR